MQRLIIADTLDRNMLTMDSREYEAYYSMMDNPVVVPTTQHALDNVADPERTSNSTCIP